MANPKPYDLEERTLNFTKEVISFANILPKTVGNYEVAKQVVRSAGSIGANYIEANDSLGKKDFAMRIRICRKESKETRYWLTLIEVTDENLKLKQRTLTDEADQLMKIFGAILQKTKTE
jgi:four helix bundle protein